MKRTEAVQQAAERYERMASHVDERARRLLVASEALSLGSGSIAVLSRTTKVSPQIIARGIRELNAPELLPADGRIRKEGGGRKSAVEKDPALLVDLEKLIEPVTRGDPMSCRRWTCKSIRKLSAELGEMGHVIGPSLVGRLLHQLGYSLQSNRKVLEGASHPDRNAQFAHIDTIASARLAEGEPVISVDTKKKELVGPFKNGGKELRPTGNPEKVRVHDFIDKELGRVNPYGVYDIAANHGWVNVGIDNDTAEFAVESIRRWWFSTGKERYPDATTLLITADGGGSNGYRVRLWKFELQRLADEMRMTIYVSHFPPGTSKWNKIEHRLFSFITQHWRGKPLVSYQVIIDLIAATKTTKGLTVQSILDENTYEKGRKVSDAELATVLLRQDEFHGEWNYSIAPHQNL